MTTDVGIKFEPVMVICADCGPAGTLVGVMDKIVGTGADVAVTVREMVVEVPPPGAGVNTCTLIVSGKAMSFGLTCVVSSDGERKIVCRGVPLNKIVELGANPEPFTWSVNVTEFSGIVEGERELTAGTGRLMTPPHEVSKISPASKATVEIVFRRLNFSILSCP